MSDKQHHKSYELEPEGEHHRPEAAEPPAAPEPPESSESPPPETAGAAEPAPSGDDAGEPRAVKALDVCPNCGSPLGGVDAVVCLRCGFDLKTLKVIRTETGGTAAPAPEEDERAADAQPLSRPGTGDTWLPLGIAAVAIVILAVGYLAGAGGLFPGDQPPGAGTRFAGLLRMLLRAGVFTGSGLAGLYVLAHVVEAPFGDLKLAASRMLGIFCAAALLTYFDVPSFALEQSVEAVAQAVAFIGLSMVLFRLSFRDAATLLGLTVFAVIGVVLASLLVWWAVAG